MPANLEKAVVSYLELYGQPQSLAAIQQDGLHGDEVDDLKGALDQMAADGKIYRLEDGVDSSGMPMVWYGPVAS